MKKTVPIKRQPFVLYSLISVGILYEYCMNEVHLTAFYYLLFLLTTCNYSAIASAIATAVATVAPTIGLLPIPIRPIIST